MVFLVAIVLAAFLLHAHKDKEIWATLTGLLAVIAAVISAWPAIRVLEIQEDSSRPRPTPYFDMTSRYGLLLLRVKNIGMSVAYDVRLIWDAHPCDEEGEEVRMLDNISVLVPQDSVSAIVGRPHELFRTYPIMHFEGRVEFKNAAGKRIRYPFICSADEHRRRLVYDDEMPRTLYDLQQIPRELKEICQAIKDAQK